MNVIKLISKNSRIIVKDSNNTIRFKETGRRGPKGDTGIGLPAGGTMGQVLAKASNDDYDFEYVAIGDVADKNYEQTFITSSSVTVNHNLDKYPSLIIKDSAGDQVEGTVNHIDKNSLTVSFSAPFSGIISCN